MTTTTTTDDPARQLWRRQLVLTLVTIAVGGVALGLMQLSIAREEKIARVVLANGSTVRSASYLATLWPAALAVLAVVVVLAALVVHTYRVASFTFRRGDN